MTDSKALIERLRRRGPNGGLFCECGDEAADHIEKLEADNARLRAALEQIKGYSEVNGMTRQRMKRIARAALQETSHDA